MSVVPNSDLYPLTLLTGYKLIPTGSGKGVMAVCDRHDGEVSALVVNSLSESPLLADLAYMAGEHEAEHHDGPSMPDLSETDAADEGEPAYPTFSTYGQMQQVLSHLPETNASDGAA
ncbi:MAG: hypothetical protein ABW046_07095 [Actinoplanes sp.]